MTLKLKLMTALMIGASPLIIAACSDKEEKQKEDTVTEAVQTEDQRLAEFFDAIFDRDVANSPNRQTRMGLKTDSQGKWSDTSDAQAAKDRAEDKEDLVKLIANFVYEKLSPNSKISFDLFKYNMSRQIENAAFRRHDYVSDQFRGQFASPMTLLQNNHKIDTVQDAKDYISRLNGIEALMGEMVAKIKDRAEFGVIPPAFAFPAMVTDISKTLTGAPMDSSDRDHPLYADFKGKVSKLDIADTEKTELIEQAALALKSSVRAGYQALLDEIKRTGALQDKVQGVWSLPNGEAYYNNRVKNHTNLNMTADEIHNFGLEDVARIHIEMEEIMKTVGFEGNLQEFFAFVRTDPNNFYENSDAGREVFLAEARAQTAEIFEVADQYFHKLPKAALEVRRVEPWRENSTSIAFYNSPSVDGSRPGVYYANLADMEGVQKYVFKAITYHEGVPGHHFQVALSRELEGLPKFRKFGGGSAFGEGWALYAEKLAKEMGFYKDPMHDFGRLQDEIWRSVRLVTDTGIHSKKWTRQQAIDYFMENTPISPQDIVTEVERFFVNPGQGLSYKMGMTKILELRAKAKAELGDKFDIRDFHTAVIGSGALPLPLLETQVNAYIAEKLK